MVLLEDESQLDTIKDELWIYDGIFLIEYVDYRNEQGLYEKTRVIFVDGVLYPRHSIVSDQWSIHGRSRSDLMDQDLGLCHREERFLANLADAGLNRHGAVLSAINERIGLDVFGIDFALVGEQIVIFEVNACMNFLAHYPGDDGRYRYLLKYIRTLKRAVKRMLMTA